MKYSDFTLYVKPEVGGAPDFLIERAVRDTAIDFCQRTDVYIPEPEFITIIEGVNEYAVTILRAQNSITSSISLMTKQHCAPSATTN